MDEERGPTVADLLPARLSGMKSAVEGKMREDPDVGGLKLAWGFIASQLQETLRNVLDCPAIDLLGDAWTTAEEVREAADPARHGPDEVSVVHLGAHEFVREIHPVVTVTIGSCPPQELRFTISLAANFDGVALSIRDGRITSGRTGDAHVSAQLKYGEVPLHEPSEAGKRALPGSFAFAAPGLKVPARQSRPEDATEMD
jgi:hypothetical protein